MINKTFFIALFFSIFYCSNINAQVQNPPGIKWMKIDTNHVKIIFPKEIEPEAMRVANIVNHIYNSETKSLKAYPKKLPIVLVTNSTVPNGFAGLRPRRSVWFTTPSQYTADLGNGDWMTMLASHEFRHVVQYSKINKNFTKFLSILFGQTGILMGEYSIPYWFFEGDAICMENALTKNGRGRIPQFEMPVRTLLYNGKIYDYQKAKFNSYKDFYPSKYNLGWLLTSYARDKYGADIWDKVMTHTSKISFWPFAFSVGLKKYTGKYERQLYNEAMDYYKPLWDKEMKTRTYTKIRKVNTEKKKIWTKYTEANYLENGDVFCKKGDLKNLTAFYTINPKGEEKKIKTTDADMISVKKGKVVWARQVPSLRWAYKNYSDIIIFDIKTKKEKRLTKKKKYFAPALSPDAKKIAVVEHTPDLQTSICIIDAESGELIQKLSNPENDFLRTPVWSEDGTKIAYISSKYEGAAIKVYDYKTNRITEIVPYTKENIGRPEFYKNYILYNSPYNGIGNIHAVDIGSLRRFEVSSRPFGAYNARVSGDKLFFIDYQVDGYDVANMSLTPSLWRDVTNSDYVYKFRRAEKITEQENTKDIFSIDNYKPGDYKVKKFNRFLHTLNIHSWQFYPDMINPYKINFDLYSGNYLNTFFVIGNASYNFDKKIYSTGGIIRISRFFPIFDISANYGERRENYDRGDFIDTEYWHQLDGNIAMTIPLNLSYGLYYRDWNTTVRFGFKKNYDYVGNRYFYDIWQGELPYMSYTTQFSNFRRTAHQDLYSKYGQFLYFRYDHTPFGDEYRGEHLVGYLSFYLPGIFKNHSTILRGAYEQHLDYTSDNGMSYFVFGSSVPTPRGHTFYSPETAMFGSIDYKFSFWYPDWGISPVIYFKRMRAGFFYDFLQFSPLSDSAPEMYIQQSAGAEIHIQMYLFGIEYPVELGYRASYLFDENNTISHDIIFMGFDLNLNDILGTR